MVIFHKNTHIKLASENYAVSKYYKMNLQSNVPKSAIEAEPPRGKTNNVVSKQV